MPAADYTKGLSWLGHSSFRLVRGGVTIYFDPWKLTGQPHDADLILITHPHFDHLSPGDVAKVAKADTEIVTVPGAAMKLEQAAVPGRIHLVKPGDTLTLKGVKVEAVPAYNLTKVFHLRSNEWVGFIVEVDGTRIYHAGDTDFIPEMKMFQADVALLPVSGTYVMTAEEAARAAKAMTAKVVIPMHYGSIVGTAADAKQFEKLCGVKVVEILVKEGGEKQ
ncbi:MAG: MBL fold metallo-hydrolase [Candidatus Omnitrophica bacterium]|nr:MBL fold metallo-hydrolase [Candidatus Omnitrophota bacterium]